MKIKNELKKKVISNNSEEKNPIFVVGSPRSGTSLVARAISLFKDVCYLEESGIFHLIYGRWIPHEYRNEKFDLKLPVKYLTVNLRNTYDNIRSIDRLEDMCSLFIKSAKVEDYGLIPSDRLVCEKEIKLQEEDIKFRNLLKNKYTKKIKQNIENWPSIMMGDFKVLNSCENALEKTPIHYLYIPLIEKIFEDPRIVFCYRNKKQVLSSYLSTFEDRHASQYFATKYINKVYDRAMNIKEENKCKENVFTLKYISFVENTRKNIERLSDFLSLDFGSAFRREMSSISRQPSKWHDLSEYQHSLIARFL